MGIASDFDQSGLAPHIAALMVRARQRSVDAGCAVLISDRADLGVLFLGTADTVNRVRAAAARRGATVEVIRD